MTSLTTKKDAIDVLRAKYAITRRIHPKAARWRALAEAWQAYAALLEEWTTDGFNDHPNAQELFNIHYELKREMNDE